MYLSLTTSNTLDTYTTRPPVQCEDEPRAQLAAGGRGRRAPDHRHIVEPRRAGGGERRTRDGELLELTIESIARRDLLKGPKLH